MASRYLPLYDIDKPVGPNKPNLMPDVLLIRALLSKLQAGKDPNTADIPPIPTTGGYDDALGAAILSYQKTTKKRGGAIATDGIIDPMPKADAMGDISAKFANGMHSTLNVMNVRLFRINRGEHLKIGDNLNLPWKPDPFEMPS